MKDLENHEKIHMVEARDTSNEAFVEIKIENQDGNEDLEVQLNEVPEIEKQIDSVMQIQENTDEANIDSENEKNTISNTAKKVEVIKLKILPQPKKLQCNVCAKYFKYNSGVKRHQIYHNVEKSFQCKTCLKTFSQKGTLKRHEIIHSAFWFETISMQYL